MKLTKITFNMFSKRNKTKFQHKIFADGHLTMIEVTNKIREYVSGRDLGGMLGLQYTDTKIVYLESVDIPYPVS